MSDATTSTVLLVVAFLAAPVLALGFRFVFWAVGLLVWLVRWLFARRVRRARLWQARRIRRKWRKTATAMGLVEVKERRTHDGKLDRKTIVPRIGAWPEPWGVRVHLSTLPKVGAEQYDRAADWLADAWRADSVEVDRFMPGRVELRAVFGDPLDEHRPYPWPIEPDVWALPVGHNPWGEPVTIPVRNLSGIKIGGLPGYGKSALLTAWAAMLAERRTVQLAIFDGKTRNPGLGDWGAFHDRALVLCGDSSAEANGYLDELVKLIKARPEALRAERGTHKFWEHGPSIDNPLLVVILDEAHNYVDAAGTDRKTRELIESNQRALRTLVKEGRSLGVLTIVATQKGTADALPTAIRDNLETGLCFAVATIEAAEAVLGAGIRADAPNHPTLLLDKTRHVGVCVATGVPGLDGRYARVRVGDIDDYDVNARAAGTAGLRIDLATLRDASRQEVPA